MKIAKKFTQEILHELKMSTAQGAASPEQDDERVRSPEGWTGLWKKHCNARELDATRKAQTASQHADLIQ